MGDARSPVRAHSFGRIFEQGMTASQPSMIRRLPKPSSPCSDKPRFLKIAEILLVAKTLCFILLSF